jgi:peptidoglycan/xylan/chitin deacetylase (PgdA/CDA1 family)
MLVGVASTAVASSAMHSANDAAGDKRHVIRRVKTKAKLVALTFDDGPDPAFTPRVLEILDRFHAHATFFVVGQNVEQRPDLVRAEIAAGNDVENHTYDHPDLAMMTAGQVNTEIERGAAAIRAAGAPDPTMFRPPGGLTDDLVRVIADAHKYQTIAWGLAVEHFVNHMDMRRAVDEMMARVRPGVIILAHDGRLDRTRTMVALPYLLARLRGMGYQVVTVRTMIHVGNTANAPR